MYKTMSEMVFSTKFTVDGMRLFLYVLLGYSFLLSLVYLHGYWSFLDGTFLDFYSISEIVKQSIVPSVLAFVFLCFYSSSVFILPRIFFFINKKTDDSPTAKISAALAICGGIITKNDYDIPIIGVILGILVLSFSMGFFIRKKFEIDLISSCYVVFFSIIPLFLCYEHGVSKSKMIMDGNECLILENAVDYKIGKTVDRPLKYLVTTENRSFFMSADNSTIISIPLSGNVLSLKRVKNDK